MKWRQPHSTIKLYGCAGVWCHDSRLIILMINIILSFKTNKKCLSNSWNNQKIFGSWIPRCSCLIMPQWKKWRGIFSGPFLDKRCVSSFAEVVDFDVFISQECYRKAASPKRELQIIKFVSIFFFGKVSNLCFGLSPSRLIESIKNLVL